MSSDETAFARIKHIAALPGVKRVVALNDLHQGKQETPVSVAVATEHMVYPQLSSNVINCGMSLMKTELTPKDLDDGVLTLLAKKLASGEGRALFKPDATDIPFLLLRGAEYVVEKWNLPPAVLENIENNGNMFAKNPTEYSVDAVVPSWILNRAQLHKELPLPDLITNHFLEFQVVTNVQDVTTAEEWGIQEGRVVVYLHVDYPFTNVLNWHYASRLRLREAPLLTRMKYGISRWFFQSTRGILRSFSKTRTLYFNKELFLGFDTRMEDGKRLVAATYMAMNYAYASRLLASLYVRDCLDKVLGRNSGLELVWDVAHDSIQKELLDGKEYWVSRKGAGNAVPEKPVLIAGSYNMDSFLGKGFSATEILRSYDHGCSRVIEEYRVAGKLFETSDETKQFSTRTGAFLGVVKHLDGGAIRDMVQNLCDENVVAPVAWLRPLVNFKHK